MKECLRCENKVTNKFHRCNSNNDGELWGCHRCTTGGEVLKSEDETSKSSRYERNLERIRQGKGLPQHENR